jgi:diguanylate cyclase (GGDEF)-like protein
MDTQMAKEKLHTLTMDSPLEVMQKVLAGILAFIGIAMLLTALVANAEGTFQAVIGIIGVFHLFAALRVLVTEDMKLWHMEFTLLLCGAAVSFTLITAPIVGTVPFFYLGITLFAAYYLTTTRLIVFQSLIVAMFAVALYYSNDPLKTTTFSTVAFILVGLTGTVHLVRRYVQGMMDKLLKAATHDMLTGVCNRTVFESDLEDMRSREYSLALLDLDYFKHINDSFGHKAGDQALIDFAKIVNEKVRDGDTFARIGGEEFGILMPETPTEVAYQLCQEMRQAVEESRASQRIAFTVSIGLAAHDFHKPSSSMRLADKALYTAKEQGRNQVFVLKSFEGGLCTDAEKALFEKQSQETEKNRQEKVIAMPANPSSLQVLPQAANQ